MTRAYKKSGLEIEQEQCGFVQDTVKRNVIFLIRMLSVQMQKDI